MQPKTHISYETAKALNKFLGDSAPAPMELEWFYDLSDKSVYYDPYNDPYNADPGIEPAYKLHDLLSKPFCEAIANKLPPIKVHTDCEIGWNSVCCDDVYLNLSGSYKNGGLPAVEQELLRMIEEAKQ